MKARALWIGLWLLVAAASPAPAGSWPDAAPVNCGTADAVRITDGSRGISCDPDVEIASGRPATVAPSNVEGYVVRGRGPRGYVQAGSSGPRPHIDVTSPKYGASPSASGATNRAAFNAAWRDVFAAGGGSIYCPPGKYNIAGSGSPLVGLDIQDKPWVSMYSGGDARTGTACQLNWTEASGYLVKGSFQNGRFQGVSFTYDDVAYHGTLVSFKPDNCGVGPATRYKVLDGQFYGLGAAKSASTLLDIRCGYEVTIANNVFGNAVDGIRGAEDASTEFSNVVSIVQNEFNEFFTGDPIRAGGQSWLIANNNSEPVNWTTHRMAFVTTTPAGVEGLAYLNNWHGVEGGGIPAGTHLDASTGPGIMGGVIAGNYNTPGAGPNVWAYKLGASDGVSVCDRLPTGAAVDWGTATNLDFKCNQTTNITGVDTIGGVSFVSDGTKWIATAPIWAQAGADGIAVRARGRLTDDTASVALHSYGGAQQGFFQANDDGAGLGTTSGYQVFLRPNGDVGIGTTTPTISGGGVEIARAGAVAVRLSDIGNGRGIEYGLDPDGGYIRPVTGSTGMRIFGDNVDAALVRIAPSGDVTVEQNGVTPFTSVAAGAGNKTVYITGDKVGIRLNNPDQALTVDGDLRLTEAGGVIRFGDVGGADETLIHGSTTLGHVRVQIAGADRLQVKDGLSVGSSTDPGAGYIDAANGFKVANAALNFSHLAGAVGCAQLPALTGDVTTSGCAASSAGSAVLSLVNIPNDTPMAGDLLATAIAAPSTPASGQGRIFVDSTSKNAAVKDDAGVVKHMVKTQAAVSNSWVTSIDDDGTVNVSQPAFGNISGTAAVSQGGTGDTGTAWSTYTPTITCNSGSITTLGTVTGRYKTLGKTTFVQVSVGITTIGTCSSPQASLPHTAAAAFYFLAGFENTASGKMLIGVIPTSDTKVWINMYDGSAVASGSTLHLSGVYESS